MDCYSGWWRHELISSRGTTVVFRGPREMICFALLRLMVGVFRGPCEVLVGVTHSLASSGDWVRGGPALSVRPRNEVIWGCRPSRMLSEETVVVFPFHFPWGSDWDTCSMLFHHCSVLELRYYLEFRLHPYSCEVCTYNINILLDCYTLWRGSGIWVLIITNWLRYSSCRFWAFLHSCIVGLCPAFLDILLIGS